MKTLRPKKGQQGRQELEQRDQRKRRSKLKPPGKEKYKISPRHYESDEEEPLTDWDLGGTED